MVEPPNQSTQPNRPNGDVRMSIPPSPIASIVSCPIPQIAPPHPANDPDCFAVLAPWIPTWLSVQGVSGDLIRAGDPDVGDGP